MGGDHGETRGFSSSDSESESPERRRRTRRKKRSDSKRRKSSSRRDRRLSSSSPSEDDSESPERRRRRKKKRSSHRHRRHRSEESSRKRKARPRNEEEGERRKRRSHHKGQDASASSSPSSSSSNDSISETEALVRRILRRYPDAAADLKQLLQMIDNGQGVDVSGIPNKSLLKLLKKLFRSLKLKHNDSGIFSLPPRGLPTLQVIGSMLCSKIEPVDNEHPISESPNILQSSPHNSQSAKSKDASDAALIAEADGKHESPVPNKRRFIGPAMPSRELLAAAAELTEAENLLREADVEADNDLLIGPPPPAMVAEAESANEAERFEEVARIAGADVDKPYDVLGVNWRMSSENIKKRYWKLSLMVHPDKCSHPQAHQAFVILNKAFKELQDPDKRKALDEKIKLKEEQEAFKVELQAFREAAQWRRSQGISIEGDEELLAMTKEAATEAPKREEWMTTLPPERKPGVSMQSTSFSRTTKEGRGDTSIWTDSPLDKAGKAKQNYLEAYNKAKSLAEADDQNRRVTPDAELVDKYNSSKRSVSLLQKHREESSRPKKKGKQPEKKAKQPEKEEWVGNHPWKPWDREKDLTAGRKNVNFDSENIAQGLTSRFSSGTTQRNFL